MKLVLHYVLGGTSATVPGSDGLTTADVAALPQVGDSLVFYRPQPQLQVKSRYFHYGGDTLIVELHCIPAP